MTIANHSLSGLGDFSGEELALFEKKIVKKSFKKSDILLQEGKICESAFYILSGSSYQFFSHEIDENIIDLHIESDWCMNYKSFINQKPSTATLKAYTEMEVVELTIASAHELISLSATFFQLGKVLAQTLSRLQCFDNANTALQKHNQLFLSKPALFQQFPLKMIASYLKITPETLSRIRNIR